MNRKIYIKFVISFISLFLSSCSETNQTWHVVLVGLPPKVSSEFAHSNSVGYLLRQTHEPIFRVGKNNDLYSNILSSWKRSEDSKKFDLCIKDHLEFMPSKAFHISHLKLALDRLKRKHESVAINTQNNCATIKLTEPIPSLFDSLLSYEYAPEIEGKDPKQKVGLGLFFISSWTESEIQLERKNKAENQFNLIRVFKLSSMEESLINTPGKIQDFNRIPLEKIPDWVKQSYIEYPAPLLKTHGVLLNITNSKIRKRIFNCLDLDLLRKSFFPTLNNPIVLSTILPMGIDGAKEGKLNQNCTAHPKINLSESLVFANWKHDAFTPITNFFSKSKSSLGFKVDVINFEQNKLTSSLYGSHEGYDILIVAIDTDTDAYQPFFEPFLDSNKIIHKIDLSELNLKYKKLISATSKSHAKMIAVEIDRELRERAIFIPLVQDVRTFYFPKNLSNLIIGNNFLGHIEVGKLTP